MAEPRLAAERDSVNRLARERFVELIASTESPTQLAALLRVIDKVPWEERPAAKLHAPAFPDLERMALDELISEARRLIEMIEAESNQMVGFEQDDGQPNSPGDPGSAEGEASAE